MNRTSQSSFAFLKRIVCAIIALFQCNPKQNCNVTTLRALYPYRGRPWFALYQADQAVYKRRKLLIFTIIKIG